MERIGWKIKGWGLEMEEIVLKEKNSLQVIWEEDVGLHERARTKRIIKKIKHSFIKTTNFLYPRNRDSQKQAKSIIEKERKTDRKKLDPPPCTYINFCPFLGRWPTFIGKHQPQPRTKPMIFILLFRLISLIAISGQSLVIFIIK